MSVTLLTTLADAVVTLLNGHAFSQAFTAVRVYDAMRPLDTLETLHIDVILGDRKSEPLNRLLQKDDVRVEVAARQVVNQPAGSAEETAALDALVVLMEEIDTFLSAPAQRRPTNASWAGWQGSELVYPYLPSQLRTSRQFTSLLRLTYLVAREGTP